MSTGTTIAIVGGGLAAAKAVETLRDGGHEGRLVVVGAEAHAPYERPPLSKGYLLGNDELDSAEVHPPQWYADRGVELWLGTRATALDPDGHLLTAERGTLEYSQLLIATGAVPRHLALADESGVPVVHLRSMDDSRRLRARLEAHDRVVIVGGGWIGLEVASAARNAGCEVTVLEAADLPLVRVLGPEVARVFDGLHRDHGVDLRTGVQVAAVRSEGGGVAVGLGDGSTVTGDLLVVGVGVTPDVALAEAAGLDTDNGVLVDEHLRTSHPDVLAAGDVANAYHPLLHRRLRVEHWDNAIEQGRAAARTMLGGTEPYDRLPYFFTDQYDVGIEYVGNVGPEGYDEVVLRGDVAGRVFTAFWVQGGRVVAGMHVNDWDAIDPVRRIVEAGATGTAGAVDLDRLRDERVPLDEVVG
jgi:3-phenylpropionate/trans-cinnamate dioxygenase ferredoxin reductase subunit